MAGPTSPSAEGPTYAPPPLPAGWIAQWDGASKKYYYVQLSTGVSQWDTPTEAAPTGLTPTPGQQGVEVSPYGTPQPELITHPDGTQTKRHHDGTMEPVMPTDGSRAMGGDGDRGFTSMATNALLGKQSQSSGHNSSSNPLGLAGQLIGTMSNSSHSSGSKNSGAGKLVGQLASGLFSSSSKPQQQPQNYYGGQSNSQQHGSSGIAGAVMGGMSSFLGSGKTGHGGSHSNQNYGYSNSGGGGSYNGQAPPSSYSAPTSGASASGTSSYQTPPGAHQSFPPPAGGSSHQQSYQTGGQPQGQYPPPPSQYPGGHAPPPQQGYGAPTGQPSPGAPYGSAPPQQPTYGAPSTDHHQQQQQYGGYNPSTYGGAPPPHGQPTYHGQPQYGNQQPHGQSGQFSHY